MFLCVLFTWLGLRHGKLWFRAEEACTLRVEWVPAYQTDCHPDLLFVFDSAGILVWSLQVPQGSDYGQDSLTLPPGQYVLQVAGKGFRYFLVSVNAPAVWEPAPFYRSKALPPDERAYWFRVELGTDTLRVFARRRVEEEPPVAVVYDPSGSPRCTLELPAATSEAYFPYDSCVLAHPEPGFWRLEFPDVPTYSTTVAFWLSGARNLFALDTSDYFVPSVAPTLATLRGGPGARPRVLVGGSGVWGEEYLGPAARLGLETGSYYVNQNHREPANDNPDPTEINWSGFEFDGDDWRVEQMLSIGMQPQPIFVPADWLLPYLHTPDGRREYAEFILAYLIHHNIQRNDSIWMITPYDEPNCCENAITYEEYQALAETVATWIASYPDPRVSGVKVLVPYSSNFIEGGESPERVGKDWARALLADGPGLFGGVAWNEWNERDIGRTLIHAWAWDTARTLAGDSLLVVVGQTNLSSGPGISPFDVNGPYAGLWWASVLARVLGKGPGVIQWFTTYDDPHHKKGMIYPDGTLKPVGKVQSFLADFLLPWAVELTSDNPLIPGVCLTDGSGRANVLLVNPWLDSARVHLDVDLELLASTWSWRLWTMKPDSSPRVSGFGVVAGPSISLDIALEPRVVAVLEARSESEIQEERQPTGIRLIRTQGELWLMAPERTRVEVYDPVGRRIAVLVAPCPVPNLRRGVYILLGEGILLPFIW